MGARLGTAITARGVELVLGGNTIVDGISLEVDAGEVVAILGPSGSGKSSLLYCLSGLVRSTRGTVWTAGEEVSAMTSEQAADLRRRRLGFVFQSSELVPELTLRENVELPLWLLGRPRRTAAARAAELLERLDLQDRADARPAFVSGGQAQRAAIARAIAHDPAVVFADEPTGALDSASGAVVLEALTGLAREHGTTVLIVTHDAAVAGAADREIWLRDGRVAPEESRAR